VRIYLIIGLFLIVTGIIAYLTIPLYFPGYSTVSSQLKQNHKVLTLRPEESRIITQLSIGNNSSAVIVVTNESRVNVSIEGASGHTFQEQGEASVSLPAGYYNVSLINTTNSTQTVSLTYGVFNAQFISNFYYNLQVLETILEFIIVIGIGIVGWQILTKIFSRRK